MSQVELSLNYRLKYSPPTPSEGTISAVMEVGWEIVQVMVEFEGEQWRGIVVIVMLALLQSLYPSHLRRLGGLRG
jgi:hypothetical protein